MVNIGQLRRRNSAHFSERHARGARDLSAVVELRLGIDDPSVERGDLAAHLAKVGLEAPGVLGDGWPVGPT